MSRRKEPAIPNELLDQLLAGGDAGAALAQGGLLDALKKALTERALNAEMDHHLAGEDGAGNSRNGYGRKTITTDTGKLAIDVPRDRQASFDPQLIAKYQRRFPGFDDKIVSMYARGMSTREITGHLHDLYGIDVSPDLISTVTDAVLDEVAIWQQRPLDPVYPLVFFDAIRVKIRDEGMVRNKAIHIALGVRADGAKEVLGLWLEQNEGAKFWLRVMNELRNRGTEDILLAVVDGPLWGDLALQTVSDGSRPARSFLEAMDAARPGDVSVLLCGAALAPALSIEEAVAWSVRLRTHGLAERCPLVALSRDEAQDPRQRAVAAAIAVDVYSDERAVPGLEAALADVSPEHEAELASHLEIVAPGLVSLA